VPNQLASQRLGFACNSQLKALRDAQATCQFDRGSVVGDTPHYAVDGGLVKVEYHLAGQKRATAGFEVGSCHGGFPSLKWKSTSTDLPRLKSVLKIAVLG
jgi:hypothetical protein